MWCKGNIHGHLHSEAVITNGTVDGRYMSACLERNDFKPVDFEEFKSKVGN